MSFRILHDNLLDASGVVFTATSAQSDLPVENVVHDHLVKVWRTTGSSTTERVVIDLGSAQSATAFIIAHADDWSSYANVTLEANTSDSWSSPAFSQSITADLDLAVTAVTFSSQSYRYWRFSFDKPSAGTLANVSRLFLGPYVDITECLDYADFDQGRNDPSVKYRSIGGQTWSDQRTQFKTFTGGASHISQSSSDSLETIAAAVGEHTPFFFRADTASDTGTVTGAYHYVKFTALKGRKVESYDGSEYKWNIKLEMEEQL